MYSFKFPFYKALASREERDYSEVLTLFLATLKEKVPSSAFP